MKPHLVSELLHEAKDAEIKPEHSQRFWIELDTLAGGAAGEHARANGWPALLWHQSDEQATYEPMATLTRMVKEGYPEARTRPRPRPPGSSWPS